MRSRREPSSDEGTRRDLRCDCCAGFKRLEMATTEVGGAHPLICRCSYRVLAVRTDAQALAGGSPATSQTEKRLSYAPQQSPTQKAVFEISA